MMVAMMVVVLADCALLICLIHPISPTPRAARKQFGRTIVASRNREGGKFAVRCQQESMQRKPRLLRCH
jgi:hypothetical protein